MRTVCKVEVGVHLHRGLIGIGAQLYCPGALRFFDIHQVHILHGRRVDVGLHLIQALLQCGLQLGQRLLRKQLRCLQHHQEYDDNPIHFSLYFPSSLSSIMER